MEKREIKCPYCGETLGTFKDNQTGFPESEDEQVELAVSTHLGDGKCKMLDK